MKVGHAIRAYTRGYRTADLGVVTTLFAGCARERVVVVVRLLVEPRLHAGTHSLAEVAVDVQVLTEALVAETARVERRLPVVELAPVRPLLSQLGQLAVPPLYSSRPTQPFIPSGSINEQ